MIYRNIFLASVLLANFLHADSSFESSDQKSKCEALHDAFDFMLKIHKKGMPLDLQTHLASSFSHRDIAECHRVYVENHEKLKCSGYSCCALGYMVKERLDEQDLEIEISLTDKDGSQHDHWFLDPKDIKKQLARLEKNEKDLEREKLK